MLLGAWDDADLGPALREARASVARIDSRGVPEGLQERVMAAVGPIKSLLAAYRAAIEGDGTLRLPCYV